MRGGSFFFGGWRWLLSVYYRRLGCFLFVSIDYRFPIGCKEDFRCNQTYKRFQLPAVLTRSRSIYASQTHHLVALSYLQELLSLCGINNKELQVRIRKESQSSKHHVVLQVNASEKNCTVSILRNEVKAFGGSKALQDL